MVSTSSSSGSSTIAGIDEEDDRHVDALPGFSVCSVKQKQAILSK